MALLKEQLLLLLDLHRIDTRVHEVQASITTLPQKLQPAKNDLAKLEALLAAERARVAETEAWRKEQEELIRQDDGAVHKAKAKIQAAKSPKDFAAASREVDNKRKSMSDREEEVLKVIEALEKNRADIIAHEQDVAALRAKIEAEEAKIGEVLKELVAEASTITVGRDEIAAKIEPLTLKKYDVTMRGRGYGIAPVVAGACQGCHMSLPPQLNNILAAMETIEICPTCRRILYRKEILEPPAEPPAEQPES